LDNFDVILFISFSYKKLLQCSFYENFSKITLWRFFYARNRSCALKNLENASLTLKSTGFLQFFLVFGLIWGQGSVFKIFQCAQSIPRIENPHRVILE
jgi:hypothetical protein